MSEWSISLLIIISILIVYVYLRRKRILHDPIIQESINQSTKFNNKIVELRKDYFRWSIKENLKEEFGPLRNEVSKHIYSRIKNSDIELFKETFDNIDLLVQRWNKHFVDDELVNSKVLFDNIDGKSLDQQQRMAVVVDEDNNLVLAGAGSGKTLTVAAKVKYLVEKKNIKPEEILLISFTRKAANEMQERINQKLNIGVEAKTFHKLGLEIITQANKQRPDVNEELDKVVQSYFKDKISNNADELKNLIEFFGVYFNIPVNMRDFDNLGEVYDQSKGIDLETIKHKISQKTNDLKLKKETINGETVKSLDEVVIANFLYLNGVDYTYEKEYPYDTKDPYRKKYRPDFYLNDYDIYLEHFGITEDYKTPWLSPVEEQKYIDGITWKRQIHNENGTKLIETYSYYNKNGRLLIELEKLLKQNNVKFKKVDYSTIFDTLYRDQSDKYFKEFNKLICSFISLFKSRGLCIDDFEKLKEQAIDKNIFMQNRTIIFLSIVKPIFSHYQDYLKNLEQIDFNDMINEATNLITNRKVGFKLKYIIVDEYQDISVSRYKLIKEIRDLSNTRVMVVGDDWQSIYRFTGSDIDLFTNFINYFGHSELLKIEKTYRNSQELIDIAGNFIMKNPKQLNKQLISDKHHSNPVHIYRFGDKIESAMTQAIEEIVYHFGETSEIMLLGRNNFDIDVFEKSEMFEIKKRSKEVNLICKKYPELKINFLTVHRSKGLEADNVIVINLRNMLVGFPNKISDDPLLSLVLTDKDDFSYAEERRLFYVAITRTKNITYLLAPIFDESIFVDEIQYYKNISNILDTDGSTIQDNPNCPKCQKGYLVLRENSASHNKFLGCSNFPLCDETINDIEILDNQIICRLCGGYMVKRKGRYGLFYGCTNFPYCKNTIKVE